MTIVAAPLPTIPRPFPKNRKRSDVGGCLGTPDVTPTEARRQPLTQAGHSAVIIRRGANGLLGPVGSLASTGSILRFIPWQAGLSASFANSMRKAHGGNEQNKMESAEQSKRVARCWRGCLGG
jgi:hypothetical protein